MAAPRWVNEAQPSQAFTRYQPPSPISPPSTLGTHGPVTLAVPAAITLAVPDMVTLAVPMPITYAVPPHLVAHDTTMLIFVEINYALIRPALRRLARDGPAFGAQGEGFMNITSRLERHIAIATLAAAVVVVAPSQSRAACPQNNGCNGSTATGTASTVGGGDNNDATGNYSTIGGGINNGASGASSTICGGGANAAAGEYSTIAGGVGSTADGYASTVGGGYDNWATANYSTVCGGYSNWMVGDPDENEYSFIGGGSANVINPTGALELTSDTICGGNDNSISASYGVIGGGQGNDLEDGASWGVIGGGAYNTVDNWNASVLGGWANDANGQYTAIGGGEHNTTCSSCEGGAIAGGAANDITAGTHAAIGGGYDNTVSGSNATVPGGHSNTASGDYAFAAGRRAKATAQGCFVWADSTNSDYTCSTTNEFRARATGGFLFSADTTGTVKCTLTAGAGWACTSDINSKTDFAHPEPSEVLERLMMVKIPTWQYNSPGGSGERHIGPIAQDFAAAFDLGGDGTMINPMDMGGVAMAASQALAQKADAQAVHISSLEAEVATQRQEMAELRHLLVALQAQVGAARPAH
jgi:hypothetical protein